MLAVLVFFCFLSFFFIGNELKPFYWLMVRSCVIGASAIVLQLRRRIVRRALPYGRLLRLPGLVVSKQCY